MAGTTLEFTLDLNQALGQVDRTVAGLADAGPLLKKLGEYLQGSTQDRFRTQLSPDGQAWQALSPRYLARKHRNRDKVLTLRGYLRSQIGYEPDGPDAVLVGSSRAHAAIHQFGGEIDIAARSRQVFFHHDKKTNEVGRLFVKKSKSNFAQRVTIAAHKITMPARPYLGVSDEDRSELTARTVDFVRGLLGG